MGKYSKYLEYLEDGKMRCLICQHTFSKQKDSCTTVLNYHFKKKHQKEWNDINGICDDEEEPAAKHPRATANSPEDVRASKINRAFMQLVAGASLPVNLLEHPAWKNFCKVAIPKFQFNSLFQQSELQSLYIEYESKIRHDLLKVWHVSIGIDEWADSEQRGVVVFYLEHNQWTHRVLGIVENSPEKNAEEQIEDILQSFDLKGKICSVIVRGSKTFKLDFPLFECLENNLNFAINEGFDKLSTFQNVYDKIQDIVDRKEETSEQFGVEKIRWMTIHDLFERALQLREVINFLTEENIHKITSSDWDTAESVVSILQPIVDSTVLIQKSGMTSSAIIPLCKVLIRELHDMKENPNVSEPIVKQIEVELKQYESNEFLQFGMMLDVRFKDCFAEDEWKNKFSQFLLDRCDEDDEHVTEVAAVKEDPFSRFINAQRIDINRTRGNRKEQILLELQKWFLDGTNMNENPIEWWARSASKEAYPILHRFHLNYLNAPAMGAATENLSSTDLAGLNDNRKLLNSDDFSKFLFLQQNLRLMGYGGQEC
ncbi:Protein CBG25428 [Caenorhabditis briggsae]|uniref:Protein CBG25428 n=2 Tax=Caenorhabditis briggsae TaxID=6238 RepID=B6ILC1_CAEBR|nr:Protein CBG25428 [Caenorhabditis briggsae]ULU14413.1 hypothetical protein L3Y34_016727 [Caenorhabditis briggsae]CAS00701.1 Protein CBG25428 [Caenorhabditis briggsae]